MKTLILAGGQGSRIAEDGVLRPKPMLEIGGRPILWHIMTHYGHFGFNEFVIALGLKGDCIKRHMMDVGLLEDDFTISFASGDLLRKGNRRPDWTVDLIDTGVETGTGGRMKRVKHYLGSGTFFMTLGDGISDVDLQRLFTFHRAHGRLATVTAVRPPARFGCMVLDGERVAEFTEKPQTSEGWINGSFFVLEPEVFDYIDGDDSVWENGPMERLARDGQLMAYRHQGFWQCVDTLRDLRLLDSIWQAGRARRATLPCLRLQIPWFLIGLLREAGSS
jgi:glucose-1-phosphate cytidylyltransferase